MWRLGSYITQGVYTVSGPFHPFGGAVDIVVVQQEDGSLKSSPWYVKFGKFQGVLKAKERVVDINVNGVDADFHMYLDPRGEAYFLREVDSDSSSSSSSSSCEEVDGKGSSKMPLKSKSMDCEFDQLSPVTDVSNGQVLTRNNSKRSRIMAFVRGRRSMKENTLSKDEKDENDLNGGRMGSLERAEMAADLLEMRWSTNLSSISNKNNDRETSKDNGDVIGGRLETGLVLHEQHFVNKGDSSGVDSEVPVMEVKETIVANISKAVDEESSKTQWDDFFEANAVNKAVDEESSETQLGDSNEVDVVNEVVKEESSKTELDKSDEADVLDKTVDEESLKTQLDDTDEPEVGLITAQGSLEIVPESYAEAGSNQGETSVEVVSCSSVSVPFIQTVEECLKKEVDETNEIRATLESNGEFQDVPGDAVLIKEVSERVVEEQLIFNDLDDSKPSIKDISQKVESTTVIYGPDPPPVRTPQEQPKGNLEGLNVNTFRRCPTYVDIRKSSEITENDVLRRSKSLPNMRSHVDDIVPDDLEEPQFYSPVGKFRSSHWDLIREDALRIKRENSEKKLSQSGDNVSKDLKDGSIPSGGPGGSWSLWPFRRSASKSVSEKKDSDVDSVQEIDGEKEDSSPKLDKTYTRALAPTAEQLASLNLAQGQNKVTFTFSTSVLGAQKVDARIYLWRWDTRIVISDVDGTITKSDVLGQFMPLVGRDWSHIGVTHLFSGIKENGYQMLYLSARAISQASLTRQFLFNLTQDGKALPDGPVVISPDGLFPSLFREVIRRAPHEFKIACLEDIRACFPSDRNPFYAGFGNRDTDEFSYLKVGIPKGKIFIINPKGEVVINRSIDSKSYASLHALVNGIFPPASGHEEREDYNSWNFWKLPPPTMD